MRRAIFAGGLAVAVALALLAVLIAFRRTPSFESFGAQIIEADHAADQVAGAVYATHHDMGGSPFSDHGKTWKADDGAIDSSIAETRFRSKTGADCVITRITVKGRPLLILLQSSDDTSCMELHNAFVSNLVKHGVKPRKKWHKIAGASAGK